MDELLKENYIKCLSYIQRTYMLAYASVLLLLSLSLTANQEKGLQSFPIPFFEVELPRSVGVFATITLYPVLGYVTFFLSRLLSSIKKKLAPELAAALETFPAISHTSKTFQVFVVLMLIGILVVLFAAGPKPMDLPHAVGSAVTFSLGYVLSLVPDRWLKSTAK